MKNKKTESWNIRTYALWIQLGFTGNTIRLSQFGRDSINSKCATTMHHGDCTKSKLERVRTDSQQILQIGFENWSEQRAIQSWGTSLRLGYMSHEKPEHSWQPVKSLRLNAINIHFCLVRYCIMCSTGLGLSRPRLPLHDDEDFLWWMGNILPNLTPVH